MKIEIKLDDVGSCRGCVCYDSCGQSTKCRMGYWDISVVEEGRVIRPQECIDKHGE